MSDEQRKDEEAEVEAHRRHGGGGNQMTSEPTDAETESDDEVEAHVRRLSARLDSPRRI